MPSPFDDFFPPDQLAYLRAHRDESRRPQLHGVAITFMVLSLLATALRINVRVRRKIDIKWDDYCIVIAQVMYLGMCLTMMFGMCWAASSPPPVPASR